jgi:hypothetical protein
VEKDGPENLWWNQEKEQQFYRGEMSGIRYVLYGMLWDSIDMSRTKTSDLEVATNDLHGQ